MNEAFFQLAVFLLLAALTGCIVILLRRQNGGQGPSQFESLSRTQAELSGRVQNLTEMMTGRLDNVTHRLGQSMLDHTKNTAEGLSKLNERLALIDAARQSISALSSEVIDLKTILGNKQARGAFGQGRMEAIIADGLPSTAYEFQHTLSNGKRPDCCIRLPNTAEVLVVDAKFPFEALALFRAAANDDERKSLKARIKTEVLRHVSDIAGKYLIPGETQDFALMFIPAESLFADLHEHCPDVVEAAFRERVVLVSPSLLMMAIQMMQSLVRDAKMREEAKLIQAQVGLLLKDVHLLGERVEKLGTHFRQANKDIDDIAVSAERIVKRGDKIAAVELGDEAGVPIEEPKLKKIAGTNAI